MELETGEEILSTMVPDKDVSSSSIGRRESASLFLFKGDSEETAEDVAVREAERVENQKRADTMAEEERMRRVSVAKDIEDEEEIVRQINIEMSISAAEEEKQRRIRVHEIARVQEELLRERNAALAAAAVELERERRVSEVENTIAASEAERLCSKKTAVEAMERERTRRMSSSEHLERAPSERLDIGSTSEDVESDSILGALSEIPVVHASKILVDENTEWQCFIQSENPDQERDHLRALRMSLEDDLKECKFQELAGDVRLLRFLRGHKQNVMTAATKFREMMALRKKHNLDAIREAIVTNKLTPDEFPGFPRMITHVPFLNAYDLLDATQSSVFYFEMSGYADFKGLVEHVTEEEWTQFFLYDMEYRAIKLDQLSRHHEKLLQTIFVRNLQGFSIARFNPRLLPRIVNVLRLATACYPETSRETLLLHTPWVFHKIWSAIKPKLAETQLSKIHMSDDAYARLVELVGGRDRLPKLLGGKNATQVIPQTGYLGRDSYALLCEDGATPAEIKAGGTLQLPFRIAANDTLCWEFEVKHLDIDFSVKMRTQGDGGAVETDKVAKSRVAAGESTAGSYTATEDGTVVLSWDNSFSWTRGKTVAYKAKVVKATHDFSCLDISGNDCV